MTLTVLFLTAGSNQVNNDINSRKINDWTQG